ncbi:tubulin-like doman-containing protein [Dactylosporangium sp. NPDC050588]|uniref:tubulin-like doman-containing protein n=1 Tax=Dactylosporangium sp. NPDC050588 TaxID=3157211 RepID=UPI00340C3CC1
MFVGLGGTGCRVGAELERRLREELCGADGMRLRGPEYNLQHLQPYELPHCLQFIYADLSQEELSQLRRRSVPNESYADVASKTASYAYDLLPPFESYPQVARNLRIQAPDFVESWLPGPEREPMVVPLGLGAGQLPTVGRAAIFETVSQNIDAVRHPITQAIGAINTSAADLRVLNRDLETALQPVDVFVAFSVAGGTGAGIFYDYLHLIDSAFARANVKANIYPLVLMPSAFDEGRGGGMAASLNAGRSLLDLFRLIDDLNQDNRNHGALSAELVSRGLHVTYPNEGDVLMRLGAAQTAFLFSKTAGIDREDLHRSIVALILSLVGLEQPKQAIGGTDSQQSFAATFINGSHERQLISKTGIGQRSVSTSLVGSLTVPFDDLADMFAGRMLARGVRELLPAPPGRAESNLDHIRNFFNASGVGAVWAREEQPFREPAAVRGATDIVNMLRTRVKRMEEGLTGLDQSLARRSPELARDFNPVEGALHVLNEIDLLRLKRVFCGDSALAEQIDKMGVEGVMENRRQQPEPPSQDWRIQAPQPAAIKNGFGGVIRVTVADPAVRKSIETQNAWYRYRTNRCWHAAWNDHRALWHPRVDRFGQKLRALVDALANHAGKSEEDYNRRADELYRSRVGVTFLLPLRTELELTYERMLRRLADRYAAKKIRPNATEGEIIAAVLGPDGWRAALTESLTPGRGPEHGLQILLGLLKQQVVQILRGSEQQQEEAPLLPHMSQLLRAAATRDEAAVAHNDVQWFVSALAGMIPAAFVPEGTGKLDTLVVYPAGAPDDDVERFLRETLKLPHGHNVAPPEFRAVNTELITVVFARGGMGVTEVAEVRQVLLDWSQAAKAPKPQHYLPWRQRLGYDQDWLATTERHRVEILQRFLAALWNGQITVSGDRDSPAGIQVVTRRGAPASTGMVLDLQPFGAASSWGSLLRAYEEWTLTDSNVIRLNFCEKLMETAPNGLATIIEDPDPLYVHVVDVVVEREIKILTDMLERLPAGTQPYCKQLLGFWRDTFSAARRRTFLGTAPSGNTFEELEHTVLTRHVPMPGMTKR